MFSGQYAAESSAPAANGMFSAKESKNIKHNNEL
jgi:hypothetical protein